MLRHSLILIVTALAPTVAIALDDTGVSPLEVVRRAESRRIEVIRRIAPSVVCVFDINQRGGGSGVLIDADGYGLTNFHVVAGLLNTRRGLGGLGDGVLYELEVLGVDMTGDVAMFRLIPPREGFRFPYAALGDSDRVRLGDNVLVLGNPFSLSEDYAPTVTRGIVTGMHRYQEGTRGNLVYTDCIQVDASINPGNSGGPLFNENGEVIGINGRISVNMRGRFNVGFGYAISANQIRRFMPALRAGLLARHGTWKATVKTRNDGAVLFNEVPADGPAAKAGIDPGDRLLAFDGVPAESANQIASVLGTLPARWPVWARIHDGNETRDVLMRLEPVEPAMRFPYEPDWVANARETFRVIHDFQTAALCDRAVERPTLWTWRASRVVFDENSREQGKPERYQVTLSATGPAIMQRVYDDGSSGRIIEYDATSARQRASAGAEAFELPPVEAMVLNALYIMHTALLEPANDLDIEKVMHAGVDAQIDGPTVHNAVFPENQWNPRLLEVLDWSPGEQVSMRFGFDVETHLLSRITVTDDLSGAQARINLDHYADIGGLRWPSSIEVDAPGLRYEENIFPSELVP